MQLRSGWAWVWTENINYWTVGYIDYVRKKAALGIYGVPAKYASIHVSSSEQWTKESLIHFIQITVLWEDTAVSKEHDAFIFRVECVGWGFGWVIHSGYKDSGHPDPREGRPVRANRNGEQDNFFHGPLFLFSPQEWKGKSSYGPEKSRLFSQFHFPPVANKCGREKGRFLPKTHPIPHPTHFNTEDWGSMFPLNVGIRPWDYAV
jgi:hypothetical protein